MTLTDLAMPPCEYLCEWVAAALGRRLGLNVPAPLAVSLDAAFASSVVDAEMRQSLTKSVGLAYGSTYEKGFTQITAEFALSTSLREQGARILAFDVLIHNPDRHADNANLHVHRDDFLVFDHDMAFSFILPVLGAPEPVEDACDDIVARHVLRPLLRRGRTPDLRELLQEFAERLTELDDGFFTGLVEATPEEWTAGSALGKIDRIVEVMRARIEAASRWLPRVAARMAK